MKSLLLHRLLVILAVIPFTTCASGQERTVASPAFLGNTASDGPFNLGASIYPSIRYQQVFAASDFRQVMPQGGVIDAIYFFRQGGGLPDPFLPSIQVDLSTTVKTVDGLSAVFAENAGSDDTVVFGAERLAVSGLEGRLTVPFSHPFFYDPNVGNLLLDVRNFAGGTSFPINANNSSSDTVSRVFSTGSVSAESGIVDTIGLVGIFSFTPVPEPSTWWLLGLMGVGFTFSCWRKARRPSHVAH